LAVAHLRLAPTSSASSSVTERLSPSGALPAALTEPAGDHDPVALGEGVGQVLGLAAPHVDLEVAGVAVAPLAVLLDALGDRDPQVDDGDAGVGEADLRVLDQVADNGGYFKVWLGSPGNAALRCGRG
jgi:hypothetical protein